MKQFSSAQLEFLKQISLQEKEDDWLRILGYSEIIEKKSNGKIIGLAGVTKRYFLIPSLFIAVSKNERGEGVASEILSNLLKKWKLPLFLTYYKKKSHLEQFYSKFGFRKILPWFGKRILCIKV